jgi:DNA-binding Xre family transcriptional regulator
MKTVTNRLRILMAEKATRDGRSAATYRAINESTGISTSTLSKWANNAITSYDKNHIAKLCEFFECDIKDLLILE